MPLSPGSRFGAYHVVGPLGRGGMGEVYRAHDPRLKREIAIKVLPAEWATDTERRSRFQREAELLAALNHPHIGAIYGIEESDGVTGLVLELVEGPSLSERIGDGALRSSEALAIAAQIADALDAAHERGIVHRDLKPDNIKVRGDGTVKILDFGLAKAVVQRSGDDRSAALDAPVGSHTRTGTILGSPRYMSPERLHGETADKRADVWAFGCILYEMLTGRPAFDGSSVAAIMAAILTTEPDWSRLPSTTPAQVSRLLRRCLEKDPKRRLRDIGDIRADIEDSRAGRDHPADPSRRHSSIRRWRLGAAAFAASAAIGIASVLWVRGSTRASSGAASPLVVRQLTNYGGQETSGAISPDGRTFAFVSNHGGAPDIWLRQVSGGEPVRLTNDAQQEQELAFASDGESIWFTRIEGGTPALWQTEVLGGQPRKVIDRAHAVAPAPDGRRLAFFVPELTAGDGESLVVSGVDGADRRTVAERVPSFPPLRPAWSDDGRSLSYVRGGLFAPRNLVVIDVATGVGRQVTEFARPSEGVAQHAWLPGGQRLVASYTPFAMALPNADLAVVDLRTGVVERLTTSVSESFSAPSLSRDWTRLIATSTRTVREVWKVPVTNADPDLNGGAAALLVDATADAMWTFAARDGRTLLYAGTATGSRNLWTLSLDGSANPRQITRVPDDAVTHSSLSPDGTRVAFVSFESGTSDIWIQNVDGSDPRRLTADVAADSWPVWSPDGDRIVYSSATSALPETRVMSADGTNNVKLLDGFFRGDWIRRPDGQGTLIVTALSGPRVGVRLIDPEQASVVWENEVPGMGVSLPMFSADGRQISAPIAEGEGRTALVVMDTATGALRTVARVPFPVTFRASWADGDQALIVNRVETTSHVVLFDGISVQ